MKHLHAPFLAFNSDEPVSEISKRLDAVRRHTIETEPWPGSPYKPQVFFAIAYTAQEVCLKYYVSEKFASAVFSQPNTPVYKDSCVEFFISFGEEKEYYNFEFNCAGTCLLGYGKGRNDRILLLDENIRLIRRQAILTPAASRDAKIGWELTVAIPLKVFYYHDIQSLKGMRSRVNFYKCGDDLPEQHFLVWNNIVSESPDFHLSDYFGSMEFK